MLILLTAMAVLLPLLAALQYYWLGQVSEAATERLQISLRASAKQFRQDFNREFIRAYLNFQMNSSVPPRDTERYQLERFEQWNQTAPYPRLISEVFVVNYDEQGRPRLSRVNAKTKRFELTEWSGEFANLRDRFALRDERSQAPKKDPLEPFAEDIPALIVPFPLLPSDKPQSKNPQFPSGFTIIKLDLDYLQRGFIPSLIRRLFDDSRNEYNLAVISIRHPERVIYSSSNARVDFTTSDASTRIFGLEAEELSAFVRTEGASQAGEQTSPRQLRLINLRYPRSSAADSATSSPEEDGHWRLMIKHQAGSLAAAVSTARTRNLAISFGILLLLAAGILVTAISTRRAERLARQQINFVAGVTHELRTPLAVICSAGENLADGIVDSPVKVAQYGAVVYREGRRLTDMVEQVLEFAGAQSGQQRYEFRSTDVSHFINGAAAACEAQIKEAGFNVETMIEENLPPVQGDSAALKRAVQNLISNAIKYDSENRWARISAQVSAGKTRDQGNEVQIAVEDRGMGISPADMAHIFEPFYRGHEAVAAQIKGSGVGLSLVKQIVEAHGGRLSVKSTPGAGSVFTIHLPMPIETPGLSSKDGADQ
jgi:signal transduction histidine kinase